MKITNLRINNVKNPMGFDMNPLSLSWTVEDGGQASTLDSAQILLKEGEAVVYDSGIVANANSLDFVIPTKLKPRTGYTLSLCITADNGEQAFGQTWFETGKGQEAWIGKWITPDMDTEKAPVFVKTFHIEKAACMKKSAIVEKAETGNVEKAETANEEKAETAIVEKAETANVEKAETDNVGKAETGNVGKPIDVEKTADKARLYICGLGVYEAYLNGKKIGDEFLAPGYHSYDFHLQAQTYDVTDLLQEGENTLAVMAGAGWFRGRLGFGGGYTDLYGNRYYLIAELHMVNKEGQETIIPTDETWQVKEAPVTFSNIYDGETYDARLENAEICAGVLLQEPAGCGPLSDRYSLPIKKLEELPLLQVLHTPKDEWVLDFGQNLTGWVEFDCQLPEGEQITLTASEIMQEDCFYHDNLRTAKTEFTYISNGKKVHVRPHFTFYGFRYMKVEMKNAGAHISEMNFVAHHLRSDFEQIGYIETGHAKVNQLFSNALWSQKDNFLDVPTDCPQRDERLGWTGDAQVFSETACYNMYMPAFYRKYLWDFRAEQSVLGGSGPNVVPRLKEGMVAQHGFCPWADAAVIIPWNTYLHYGNKSLLEETYPGMKGWVDCLKARDEANEGPHLVKEGFHFADWLALDNPNPGPFGATDPLYIASAYYYTDTNILVQSAKILGKEEDAATYGKLAEEILSAIRTTYFDENGLCSIKTQTASSIAIIFGLTQKPEEEGQALKARVEAAGTHLNTGFVGTTMLCPALTESGSHKTAVDLLLNEDFPSWLYCVNLGATTIWERWNSVEPDGSMNPEGMNSLNHYSYGSIEAWMYRYVCGIQTSSDKAGFKEVVIAPHPDRRLGYVKSSLNTAAGTYISNWTYKEDGTISYHIEIPFDAKAQLILPDGSRRMLTAGSYDL